MGARARVRVLHAIEGRGDPPAAGWTFSTGELGGESGSYTLTGDGRLLHHPSDFRRVAEGERPFAGTPLAGEFAFLRAVGGLARVQGTGREVAHTGDLSLTGENCYDWGRGRAERCRARFAAGRLVRLWRVGPGEGP